MMWLTGVFAMFGLVCLRAWLLHCRLDVVQAKIDALAGELKASAIAQKAHLRVIK